MLPTAIDSVSHQRKIFFISLIFFAAAFIFYSTIIFAVLPRGQLLKYPAAAAGVLSQKITGERILDFSPLYLELHILVRRISSSPDQIVVWLQIVLAAASVALFFQVITRFFSLTISIIGALLFMLDRSIVIYTQAFEPEPILIFLIILFLLFISSRSYSSHFFAGLALGFAFLARPNFVPMLLVIPLYFYFRHADKRAFLRSSLYCLIPILIALLTLWLRNASLTGYFSPVFMNPGTTFYEGNNPNSWGTSAMYPPLVNNVASGVSGEVDYHHQVYRSFARKIAGQNLTLPEVNRFWMQKAVNYLMDHPWNTLRLYATKLFHIFHHYQWHDLPNAFWNDRLLGERFIPSVPFALVSALSIYGLLISVKRWKEWLPFYGILFSQIFVMLMIYVSARQRSAVVSVFVFFACAGLLRILIERKVLHVALIAAAAIMLFVRSDLMDQETILWENNRISKYWLDRAYAERNSANLKEASENAARALAAAPFYIDLLRPSGLNFQPETFPGRARLYVDTSGYSAMFDAAVLELSAKHPIEAQVLLRRALDDGGKIKRDYYQSSQLYYYIGKSYLQLNNRKEAIGNLSQSLKRAPGDPWALSMLYVLTQDQEYKNRIFRYFDDVDAHFFLGQAEMEAGTASRAVAHFEYVTQQIPDYRDVWIYLAAAMGKSGRYKEGSEYYLRAVKMKQEPVMLEDEMINLFEGLVRQQPNEAKAAHLSGVVHRQFGRFERALELQKAAQKINATQEIRDEIAFLERAVKENR